MLKLPDELHKALVDLSGAYGGGDEKATHDAVGAVVKTLLDSQVSGVFRALMRGAEKQGYRVKITRGVGNDVA